MHFARAFKSLILLVAALGYLADGARAHIQISNGETLRIEMCTPGQVQTKYIDIELPGGAEHIADKCCGDCAPASPITPAHPAITKAAAFYKPVTAPLPKTSITPRSPLWPGAPPNGPPSPHIA